MTKTQNAPVIYLAGPYGFGEIGRAGIEVVIKRLSGKFKVLNPFAENALAGRRLAELLKEAKSATARPYPEIAAEMKQISNQISQTNVQLIDSCDLVLAILDGAQVDDGTAAEIGYACAKGKRIIGLRTDIRQSGECPVDHVNMQVRYFISASGGTVVTSLKELEEIVGTFTLDDLSSEVVSI